MGLFAEISINWRSALMFAVCLPIIMTAIMLLCRRDERRANIFLAGFLLSVVMIQIPQIIGFSGFYRLWPGLTFAPFDTELYLGSFLYLHAWALMNDKPLGWRWSLLIPGVVQTIYYTIAFLTLGDYKAKWAYTERIHEPYIVPIETALAILLILWASFSIYKMLRQYQVFIAETQSTKSEFNPVWLKQLLWTFVGAGSVFTVVQIISFFMGKPNYVTTFPVQLILTAAIAWLGMEALSRTSQAFPKFYGKNIKSNTEPEASGRDWVRDGQALKSAILQGEWFLASKLSLRDLAQRMNSNETYMSQTINLGLGTNFNRLINEMRVEYAKSLLLSQSTSILSVALDSGFNSKPTFNRVFREISGQTPTQYKRSNIANPIKINHE